MKNSVNIKHEIEQHIQKNVTKILSLFSEECRGDLAEYPIEITGGIHLAAILIVRETLLYALRSAWTNDAGPKMTEPYPELVAQVKNAADAFNAIFWGLSEQPIHTRTNQEAKHKKTTKKVSRRIMNAEKASQDTSSKVINNDLPHIVEG